MNQHSYEKSLYKQRNQIETKNHIDLKYEQVISINHKSMSQGSYDEILCRDHERLPSDGSYTTTPKGRVACDNCKNEYQLICVHNPRVAIVIVL